MSLTGRSVKALYPLALAEGEGVGTAYEYVAKGWVLQRWWQDRPLPRTLLVAGLPEKYGTGLDWLWLAHAWGAHPFVADERPAALARLADSLKAAQAAGFLTGLDVTILRVASLVTLPTTNQPIDLAASSEVMQRLSPDERRAHIANLTGLAQTVALFAPNGDNPAHTTISGLQGITLAEWRALLQNGPAGQSWRTGYVDLPPFPPGVTRNAAQRVQAGQGRLEALAMWGLSQYARLEVWLPQALTQRYAHIVYGLYRRQ